MRDFPYLIDADDAINYYRKHTDSTDAEKAYIVRLLSKANYSNKKIRESLGIKKNYDVTHLKRAGCALSETELELWHNNAERITLGHVRSIAKIDEKRRENLLRDLLTKKVSVRDYERIAAGKTPEKEADVKRLEERLAEKLGRPVSIKYNKAKGNGTIRLSYYSIADFETIVNQLGFKTRE